MWQAREKHTLELHTETLTSPWDNLSKLTRHISIQNWKRIQKRNISESLTPNNCLRSGSRNLNGMLLTWRRFGLDDWSVAILSSAPLGKPAADRLLLNRWLAARLFRLFAAARWPAAAEFVRLKLIICCDWLSKLSWLNEFTLLIRLLSAGFDCSSCCVSPTTDELPPFNSVMFTNSGWTQLVAGSLLVSHFELAATSSLVGSSLLTAESFCWLVCVRPVFGWNLSKRILCAISGGDSRRYGLQRIAWDIESVWKRHNEDAGEQEEGEEENWYENWYRGI